MSEQPQPPRPNLSKTSLGVFDRCQRKWLLSYERSFLPRAIQSEAFREYKLMDFSLLAGQVVDDVITESIRSFIATNSWPTHLMERARAISKEYYQLSREWRDPKYKEKPERQPISEVYYCQSPTEAEWESAFETMGQCLKHFESCHLRPFLESFPTSAWRVQDKGSYAPWFMVDGVPVYAKYDFAIVEADQAILFDWKTSDPMKKGREEDASRQLHWYAAYANSAWGIPYEQMRLAPVWLRWGVAKPWEEQPVNLETIMELKSIWKERHALLQNKLGAASRGGDINELFPFAEDTNRCKYCNFRVCERHPVGLRSPQSE